MSSRRLLGVVPALLADPSSASLAVVDVLACRADVEAVTIAPDADSRWLLSLIGVPAIGLPAVLEPGRVELPAGAGTAYPLPALWPAAVVAAPEALAARHEGEDAAMRVSWRARVASTAYALHRTAPFDLVVAAPGTAGSDVALLLSVECALPVLALLDDRPSDAGRALLDAAVEGWAPDGATADVWRSDLPEAADRVHVVEPSSYADRLGALLEPVAP